MKTTLRIPNPALFTLLLLIAAFTAQAQVIINNNGNTSPNASAMLDIESTTHGLLIPRMATTERTAISNPAEGLLVYDTDSSSFWYYTHTNWAEIGDQQTLEISNDSLKISGGMGNNYKIDLSPYLDNTDNQQLSRSGTTVTLEDGGSFQDSILTETDVDAMVANNGYLTSETDDQSISLFSNTLALENGGSVDLSGYLDTSFISTDSTLAGNSNDSIATQKAVKQYVDSTISNSGFLTQSLNEDESGNVYGNLNNLDNLDDGENNIALGQGALESVLQGEGNITLGQAALNSHQIGSLNVAIGQYILANANSVNNSVAIGDSIGTSLSFSDNSLMLGSGSAPNLTDVSNSILIGKNAGLNFSESLPFANGILVIEGEEISGNPPLISGRFGFDRLGVNIDVDSLDNGATLQVGGDLSLANGADVDEFSTDATLSDSSNTALPTEAAVKAYVDGFVSQQSDNQQISRSGTTVTLEDGGSFQDSILTETDVDAMVANNGYLTSETDDQSISLFSNTLALENGGSVDLSGYFDNTDDQQISRSGTTVILEDGGSFQDSILTETDVDAMVANNGYLTSETDNQQISRSGITVTLEDGGSFQDSILTETDVDAMVANNGYLTSETDNQQISRSGTTVTLEDGGSFQDSILTETDVDAMVANNGYLTSETDDQSISLSSNTLTLENGGSVDLSGYFDTSFISTDSTLAGNSNDSIATQKAVKNYMDSAMSNSGFLTQGLNEDVDDNVYGNLNNLNNAISGSASGNIAFGSNSLKNVTYGSNNISIGEDALTSLGTGSSNVVIGASSLTSATDPFSTVAIGYDIGNSLASSDEAILIGNETGKSFTYLANSILIGSHAGVNFAANNSDPFGLLIIEGEEISGSSPLISGKFGSDRLGINIDVDSLDNGATLQVGGNLSLANGADVDEFSTDVTLGDSSHTAIPTEAAVKTYVDGLINQQTASQTLSFADDTLKISGGTGSNYEVSLESLTGLVMAGATGSSHGNTDNFNLDTVSNNNAFGNTALGNAALQNLVNGDRNTALGRLTLNSLTTGVDNIGFGKSAGEKLISGNYNIMLGTNTLREATDVSANTAIGYNALRDLTAGDDNVALGREALTNAIDESQNTALGNFSGYNATTSNNVFLGYRAGYSETTYDSTLYIANTSTSSPLIGGSFSQARVGINKSLADLQSGATFQVNGSLSLRNGDTINEISKDVTFADSSDAVIPTQAAVKAYVDNTIANNGAGLLEDNRDNISGGNTNFSALNTGSDNVALGLGALEDVDNGDENIAIGNSALANLDVGSENVALGHQVLTGANGDGNVGVGYQAMFGTSSGDYNVGIGMYALWDLTTGNRNTAIGYDALASLNGDHNNNVAIGYQAGLNVDEGSGNVILGYQAAAAVGNISDMLWVENSSGDPLLAGDFDANKVSINRSASDLNTDAYTFQVGGSLFIDGDAYKSTGGGWLGTSDKRLKTNIEYMKSEDMLLKVLQMEGVLYEWNDTVHGFEREKGVQYGFIAQDLQKIWPSKVKTDAQGYLMTSYGDYDAMFVEAIKTLHTQLQETKATNKAQSQLIKDLTAKLEELNQQNEARVLSQKQQLEVLLLRVDALERQVNPTTQAKASMH